MCVCVCVFMCVIKQYRHILSTQFCIYPSLLQFNIHTPDDGPRSAESSRVLNNYESFINQSSPETIKSMQQLDRTYTKLRRQKMSIFFNQIHINEEMLPKYTPTYTYRIYKHIS